MIILLILLISITPVFSQIENVPFIKQKTHFCGPAALSSVLAYYKTNISQEEIAKEVYSEKINGTLITDLQNYAKKKGFNTILKTGSIEDIKRYIKQKKPVIVLIDFGIWIISVPHYLVIIDCDEKNITAHTGYKPKKKISIKEFQTNWKKIGSTYLVIYQNEKK